jgi:hypothetical protein
MLPYIGNKSFGGVYFKFTLFTGHSTSRTRPFVTFAAGIITAQTSCVAESARVMISNYYIVDHVPVYAYNISDHIIYVQQPGTILS